MVWASQAKETAGIICKGSTPGAEMADIGATILAIRE
jgi:hypothetical protein